MGYQIKWTQNYPGWEGMALIKQLEDMRDQLTEEILHHEDFDFPEANEVINRIKSK